MWARFSFWKKRVVYSPGDALVDQALRCERPPRRQQAVREKEESNNRAPTSNPRDQDSRTQGWCAHLGLPEVVSTWSACHSPSWRGRNTHPGGNRPVATKPPLPTTSSLYPVLFTDVTHSQLPVEPAEMPWRIPRCPPSHPPSLVLF